MNDPLETTFDRWFAAQAGGSGLRVGLSPWVGLAMRAGPLGATPTATLQLQKSQVFADRYVRGVLEDRRLTVPMRFGHVPRDTTTRTTDAVPGLSREGVAWWRDAAGDRAVSPQELATLGVLAVREAYHALRNAKSPDEGFLAFSSWLLTALDADAGGECGGLSGALRRLEPRVFWWWGRALERVGERTAADRAWTWQTSGPDGEGPADAAMLSLLRLAHGRAATPTDRLGFCKRAQRLLDESDFRDFDLQTHLDVARAAALIDLRYRAQAAEQITLIERRLIANPCAGAARQAAQVALLSRKAGGLLSTARLMAEGLVGVSRSATARFKLHRAYDLRRWRARRPRLPLAASLETQADLQHDGQPMRIALLRLDRLGDLVTMQPVAQRVREQFPTASIDFHVTAGLEALAESLAPGIHAVGVNWKDNDAFTRQLRSLITHTPYDLVIDLLEPDAPRELRLLRVLPLTSGGGAKVGFDSPGRREHCTHRVPTPTRPMHLIDRTSLLLRALGRAVPDDAGWSPRLVVNDKHRAEGESLLRAELGDGPWVGIHVGAGWKFKRWYPESFGRVGAALRAKHDIKVAVLAGPHETEGGRRVVDAIGPDHAALLTPTLARLPGVIAACRLMLVNDSGPMHMAAAVGVPTVVAWGPGDRTLFSPRPWNPEAPCVVVADQPRCANCPQEVDSARCPMGYRYEDVPCLRNVSEARVLEACDALLTSHFTNSRHARAEHR